MASGTGLGLPLAKHIVEDVHGGRLWVESSLGKGSTFIVTLPQSPDRWRERIEAQSEPWSNMSKRILICDDEIHILRAAEFKFQQGRLRGARPPATARKAGRRSSAASPTS